MHNELSDRQQSIRMRVAGDSVLLIIKSGFHGLKTIRPPEMHGLLV